jgi:ABC-type multidrug transport system fused ATPase/permease subunit
LDKTRFRRTLRKYFGRLFPNLRNSNFRRVLSLLTRNDKQKILVVTMVQIFLGGLDLLGVATIGVLGTLAVRGVQSVEPTGKIADLIDFLGLASFSFQSQVMVLGIAAALILVLRTILSVFFTRRILLFLSRRGAAISSNLISKLLSRNLDQINHRSLQQNLFGVTHGVTIITVSIIGTSILIISDLALLLVMASGLILVDPLVAVFTFIGFAVIGFVLYKILHIRAMELGIKDSKLTITANEKITEVLRTYREAVALNRRQFYVNEISELRMNHAETLAEVSFMPNISKYVMESAVVIGALLISAFQFFVQDASHAVATLAVFLAAGTRIAPALLRLQQGFITVKNSLGSAAPTIELMEEIKDSNSLENASESPLFTHANFEATLSISNLTFHYSKSEKEIIKNLNLELPVGKVLAIVGPSGSGKTTLVDLILGALAPTSGSIKISGSSPLKSVTKWPGALAYVPQEVVVINGSVRENILLGYKQEIIYDSQIIESLKIANLLKFVESLPHGLDTVIGEHGHILSGGQKQRLGIARAVFTNPKFLVLDEATSALDAETENEITNSIKELRGTSTLVIIAHRLSTVKDADLVVYLNNGRIEASGTFEEVREEVPNFDKQAKLMGI